ncbi:MAG: hypothetical protein GY699_17930 [Desulfobacteraceae bacterium]|nr:hypothetical protein [Desulfobacteraceae bacterium]
MNCLELSGKNLISLMGAVLERNADFRFQAKGHSMSPFIKNRDIVTMSPLPRNKSETGDIVAVLLTGKESIVVHRVVGKKKGKFIIKGDNNKIRDGLFEQNQIIGLVSKVERNGRRIMFGQGFFGRAIATLSEIGLLNSLILPILRKTRRLLPL